MICYPSVLQGSEEWFAMRKGRPTASRFSEFVTTAKGDLSRAKSGTGLSSGARSYVAELIGECFCHDFIGFAGNRFTDRGTELEPEARAAFVVATGTTVEQVGFCTRDDGIVGCSPDGLLISPDGTRYAGLEIKCPIPKTHVGYVLDGVLPDDYKQQVHGAMAVTGLREWHFYSYFPGMQALHVLVRWDDYTTKLSAALDEFVIEYGKAREVAIPKLQLHQ